MADRRSKRSIFFNQATHQLTDERNSFPQTGSFGPKSFRGPLIFSIKCCEWVGHTGLSPQKPRATSQLLACASQPAREARHCTGHCQHSCEAMFSEEKTQNVPGKFPPCGNVLCSSTLFFCYIAKLTNSEAHLPSVSGYLYSSNPEVQTNTIKTGCSFSPETETVRLEIGLGKKSCNWATFLFLPQAARVRNLTPKPVSILDWSRHIGSKIFGTHHCFHPFQRPGRDY